MSTGGWVRGRSGRSPGDRFQHQEAHPAGLYFPDDHPNAFQQQREVHFWGTQHSAPLTCRKQQNIIPWFIIKTIWSAKKHKPVFACWFIVENFSRKGDFYSKCSPCCYLMSAGDPAGDRYPREGTGASAAVSSLWEAHSESPHQGA